MSEETIKNPLSKVYSPEEIERYRVQRPGRSAMLQHQRRSESAADRVNGRMAEADREDAVILPTVAIQYGEFYLEVVTPTRLQ